MSRYLDELERIVERRRIERDRVREERIRLPRAELCREDEEECVTRPE